MSATSAGKKGGNEEYRLKELGFEVIHSGIKRDFDPDKDVEVKVPEDFLSERDDKMAVLIYCHEEDVTRYKELGKQYGFAPATNLSEIEDFRHLGPYDCLIVTDSDLMRGIDYSGAPYGIKLLISRDFPHHRAFEQGLGRVGRYGQPCKRCILPGLSAVNEEQELSLANILGQKISRTRGQQTRPKSMAPTA